MRQIPLDTTKQRSGCEVFVLRDPLWIWPASRESQAYKRTKGVSKVQKRKFTIKVKSILVKSNGDVPKAKPDHSEGKRNNGIAATLLYPREGIMQLASATSIDLANGKEVDMDLAKLFADESGAGCLLFRFEDVEESTFLTVDVTARHDGDWLVKFFLEVFTEAAGAAVALVPGGAIVGAVLKWVIGAAGGSIFGTGGKTVDVIGHATEEIKVSEYEGRPSPYELSLDLVAPKDIYGQWFTTETPPEGGAWKVHQWGDYLTRKGTSNGTVVLEISHEAA
jgi:hypothetical protein